MIEHFFGVYLLYCTNPKYKGRTYIGYTVDPRRRIKQHNAGKKHGGAWRTSNRGPWVMTLIVHGFPNSTSALRFEWAWQHPQVSRRLKHINKKRSRQTVFEYCLQVLTAMLNVGPWCRLPLTIRWLDSDFFKEYSSHISAPIHMPMCCRKVISRNIKKTGQPEEGSNEVQILDESPVFCCLCGLLLEAKESVSCIKPSCILLAHLICLANIFCKGGNLLPIEGTCPDCKTSVLWGDLIRKKLGCYKDLHVASDSSTSSTDENSP